MFLCQALEAAEPAVLAPAQPEAQDVWKSKLRRQRARLLAVSVKLKDAAQKEQAVRLQVNVYGQPSKSLNEAASTHMVNSAGLHLLVQLV